MSMHVSPQIRLVELNGFLILSFDNNTAIIIHNEKCSLKKTYVEITLQYLPATPNAINCFPNLEERLRCRCSGAAHRFSRLKGRSKQEFLKKVSSIKVPFVPATQELGTNALEGANQEKTQQVLQLEAEVEQLKAKVQKLEEKCGTFDANKQTRKRVGDGSRESNKRKLKAFGKSMNGSLDNLLQSYGLELSSVLVRDADCRLHKITLDRDVVVVEQNTQRLFEATKKSSLSDLAPEDREVLENIVALLDDHCVSDTFWKKLFKYLPNVPSLRLLNHLRSDLDDRR